MPRTGCRARRGAVHAPIVVGSSIVTVLAEKRDLLARTAGLLAIAAGAAGIVGHGFGVELLLRPLGLGPAPSLEAAVCMVVLGASSVLVVGGRVARRAAFAGGAALAVYGGFAAYRHVAHFLETGSVDGAVRALDGGTAACLAVQGAAIAFIALRPATRAPLAVTSTLTLGLATTSLLAYSIGVTMLRRYGAEIPFLVAVALALHGGGMLAWAWYADIAESTATMPSWSPLVAAISAAALFVGFTITVEGNAALLQVLLVLGAAGKLGSTVHDRLEERRAEVAASRAAQAAQRRAEVRSDEALRQGRWLETILDLAPVPLVLIDPSTARVSFANEAAVVLTGGPFTRDGDAAGLAFADSRGRPLAETDTPASRVVRGERLEGVEVALLTPSGRHELVVDGALIPQMEGQPGVAMLALQDVTRLRRVEEETARLGRIVDDAPTEVYAFDATTLRLVQENAAARRNLGYRSEELKSMSVLELFPSLKAPALEALLDPLRTGETSVVTFETEHARKDGSVYPVEARVQQSRAETAPVFVSLVENVSARRRIEAERARLLAREREARADADAGQERLAFIAGASRALAEPSDLDGTLQAVVRAAVPRLGRWAMLDLAREREAMRRVAVAMADDPGGLADLIASAPLESTGGAAARAMADGEIVLGDALTPEALETELGLSTEAARSAARTLGVAAALTIPLSARGSSLGALTLVEPLDPARWTAAERALAEEYGARAALAIHDAQLFEEAKAALRARDEFLVVASHDLRMPLSLLAMQVESMRRSVRRTSPAGFPAQHLSRFLDSVLRLARHLSVVVEDVLDPTRLTLGRVRLSIEPLDLAGLVCTVVARFGDQLAHAGSRVVLSAAETVPGEWDRFRLEQVVANLLSNAIESGAGKPIEVEVEGDERGARVRVRDHGEPLTAERKAELFSFSSRVVSARHYGGAGLGLFLVRRIVDAHGGTIDVETHDRDGTSFVVTLPRHRARQEVAA